MLKAWISAFAMALALSAPAPLALAENADAEDVFLDEGDGDFDMVPVIEETRSTEESVEEVVEEAVEKSAPVEVAPPVKKKMSKASKVEKGGVGKFVVTREACPMMRSPASTDAPMVVVKPAKKIWVETVDAKWVRGFNKAGEPGYIDRGCVE